MFVGRALLLVALVQQPAGLAGLPSAALRLGRPAARYSVRPRSAAVLLCATPSARPPLPLPRPPAAPRHGRPRILLGTLVLIYISNQWSRALPSSLVSFGGSGTGYEFMNIALGMDEVRYGWLSSYAFTALYALASLAAGRACDTFSRGSVLLVAAAGWTAATGLQACATSYPQLLASRAALGISQAFCSPAAYPMIGQAFARESRGTANAIYSSGLYLGYAFASVSALLTRHLGWRRTSLAVAIFSAAATLLLGIVLRASGEPEAEATTSAGATAGAAPAPPPPSDAPPLTLSPTQTVLRTRSAALLLVASTTRSFGGYAVGAWSVPFFRQYHPTLARDFAVANGIFIAVAGSLSTILGGWLSDRLVSRGRAGAPSDGSTAHRALYVPIVGSLLAIPLWVCVLQSRAVWPAMTCLLFSYFVAECWFGALTSTMQVRMRHTIGLDRMPISVYIEY